MYIYIYINIYIYSLVAIPYWLFHIDRHRRGACLQGGAAPASAGGRPSSPADPSSGSSGRSPSCLFMPQT